MTTPRSAYRVSCFVCAAKEGDVTIIRFGLRLSWTPSGKPAHRQVGGVYLCERCWKEAQAIRPRRGPRPGFWKGAANVAGRKGFQPIEVAA